MLFSSNIFLFLFLPVVVTIYYIISGKKFRNLFLFLASLLFYAWGEAKFVFVLFAVILFSYCMALVIDKKRDSKNVSKILLAIAISINLALLFYYKYFNFAAATVNRFGLSFEAPLRNIVLPLGISFFLFQAISYIIDVYRGTIPVQTKFIHVGLYIAFFPQLVAGPIVRYETIALQIERRRESFNDFSEGVHRFIMGFGKKMLLANNMALIADSAFSMPDAQRSVIYAWLGAITYSFQIFFDFSGYSDMAIGLGRMFGFRFLENFNYPYVSRSISEFWRRWHISLGTWFRDYVYFPLGGSRVKSTARLAFNLLVVWSLTGAWHGASWNFVLWGILYFVLIAFEKITGLPDKFNGGCLKVLYQIFIMFAVCGGWVLFRAAGLKAAIKYGLSMFGLRDNPFFCVNTVSAFRDYWFLLLFALLCSTPVFKIAKERIIRKYTVLRIIMNPASVVFYIFVFVWSFSFIVLGAHNPFIYFNF